MSIKGKAYIAGVYEHPTRKAHGHLGRAAPRRGGQGRDRGRRPHQGRHRRLFLRRRRARPRTPVAWSNYMRPEAPPRRLDRHRRLVLSRPRRSRRRGDRAGQVQRGADHACRPAELRRHATGTRCRAARRQPCPTRPSRFPYGPVTVNMYAMCAMRHMHEYGTTSEQLAWIKVAASHHAQHNPQCACCATWSRSRRS